MPEKGVALGSKKEDKPAGTLSRVFGFLLLVSIIITAGLAANGKLMPLLDSITSELATSKPEPVKSEALVQTTLQETATTIEKPHDFEPESDKENKESEALQATIERLRSELRSIKETEASLRSRVEAQQQVSLQKRLGWIVDPASRSAQLELAWREISELPNLSEVEQPKAEAMYQLAHNNVQRLRNWQKLLREHAESFETPTDENLVPVPEYPWLAWMAGQFQLRRVSTAEASLREELLDAAHALAEENWPADDVWQRLTGKLMQRVKLTGGAGSTVADLGLPESFSGIQRDIKTVRDAASDWVGSGAEAP